jgi:hypothetical protein
MATVPPADFPSELDAYFDFVKTRLEGGGALESDASPDAYRAYQRDLEKLKGEVRPSVDRFQQGERRELDAGLLKDEVTRRLADEGVVD